MSLHIEGTIEHKKLGAGAWALVSQDGQTYELHKAPKDLHKDGLKVKVKGTIRDDVMTTAMIGPILEVQSFEVLD